MAAELGLQILTWELARAQGPRHAPPRVWSACVLTVSSLCSLACVSGMGKGPEPCLAPALLSQPPSPSSRLSCSASLHADGHMRRQAAVRVTRPVTPALSQRYPLCKVAPAFLTHLLSSWYLSRPALALLQEEGLCLEVGLRFQIPRFPLAWQHPLLAVAGNASTSVYPVTYPSIHCYPCA